MIRSNCLTHAQGVKKGIKWLKQNKCGFILTELVSGIESPDCIGFKNGYSILIEVKISRQDIVMDHKKKFRMSPELGMGAYRFYLCPEGLIQPDELLPKWGLLYINKKGKVIQKVGPKGNVWESDFCFSERNIQAEWTIMASALRRTYRLWELANLGNFG